MAFCNGCRSAYDADNVWKLWRIHWCASWTNVLEQSRLCSLPFFDHNWIYQAWGPVSIKAKYTYCVRINNYILRKRGRKKGGGGLKVGNIIPLPFYSTWNHFSSFRHSICAYNVILLSVFHSGRKIIGLPLHQLKCNVWTLGMSILTRTFTVLTLYPTFYQRILFPQIWLSFPMYSMEMHPAPARSHSRSWLMTTRGRSCRGSTILEVPARVRIPQRQ